MLKVSDKEVSSVSKNDLRNRYEYFLKKIADQQEVCVLKDHNGTYFVEQKAEKTLLHMWCAKEFADCFLKNKTINVVPTEIDFDILGIDVYPLVKKGKITFSIMPINEVTGYEIDIKQFSKDLQDYIEEWYG